MLVIKLGFCYGSRGMDFWVIRVRVFLCLLAVWSFSPNVEAVIFEATSNVTYNTTAATGALTNSGWQYNGLCGWLGSYLGTPIAPRFFITAAHVGGSVGDTLDFDGLEFHTIAVTNCPNSDLLVWQTTETFPVYCPLYTASNEVGQLCVIFGRGTQRGDQVVVGGQLKGWKWGTGDTVIRWGENTVSGIATDPNLGQFLAASFDRNGITNECSLSTGDSSGGVFIQDGSTWKLAGLNYSADGLFSLDGTTNTQFFAAIVDKGGLYESDGAGGWTFFTNQVADIPGYSFFSRISAHASWINSVINFIPGNDLCISNLQPVGADMHSSLSTGSNRLYLVQSTTDLVKGVWSTVVSNLPGTGGIVTITDPGGAGQPKRFYRVKFLQ